MVNLFIFIGLYFDINPNKFNLYLPQLSGGLRSPVIFQKQLGLFLILCVFLLLNACTDGFDEVDSDPSGDVAIAVSNSLVYLSEVGGQFSVVATLTDSRGVAYLSQPVFNWESDDASIVSVTSIGVITAAGIGQSFITVSDGAVSRKIDVIVSADVVTIIGNVRYEDREYDRNGFNIKSDYFKFVRFAKVEVVDSVSNKTLQTIYTDGNGDFILSGVFNSQHLIEVSATTDISQGLSLEVRDRQNALYSVSKQVNVQDAANFTMDIPLSSAASGAFNVLDVFTSAAQFTLKFTDESLVSLNAFWQPNNFDGTYYCSGFDSIYCDNGEGVYIYNSVNGDTDEYDDDVLYHEFAHYFSQTISRDDSYGGCHVLSSSDLDLRLAWSEGWGDFFPAAVKTWLAADAGRAVLLSSEPGLTTTAYVDTYQNTQQIYIDLDSLSSSIYVSAANEMAVAKVLFSLYEQFGMRTLVDVMVNYLPAVSTPVNLEAFWDGWLVVHTPLAPEILTLQQLFAERSVYYQEDAFQLDDEINAGRKITLGFTESHYLYSDVLATDIDYVAFDVQAGKTYTVKTSQLTGGADTYLRILNDNGQPLTIGGVTIENDDLLIDAYYSFDAICGSSRIKNNGSALASGVEFVAPDTGTYYAELRTTIDSAPYLSAGRYGTFEFSVVEN